MIKIKEYIEWANSGQNRIVNLMKGIGILLVIMGHFYPNIYINSFIRSFHMPLFFILGGLFYSITDFRSSLRSNYNRLLKPFFICALMCIIGLFITGSKGRSFANVVLPYIIMNRGDQDLLPFFQVPKMFGLWFLPAIFWCKLCYNWIMRITEKSVVGGVLIVVISILSVLTDRYLINLPFCIMPGLSAMIFYLIGNLYYKNKTKAICMPILIICLICWPFAMVFSHLRMVDCYYENYLLDVMGACGGVYFIFLMSKLIIRFKVLSSILVWIGRLSLCFYCIHCIDFTIFPDYRIGAIHWTVVYGIKVCIYSLLVYIASNLSVFRRLFGIKYFVNA